VNINTLADDWNRDHTGSGVLVSLPPVSGNVGSLGGTGSVAQQIDIHRIVSPGDTTAINLQSGVTLSENFLSSNWSVNQTISFGSSMEIASFGDPSAFLMQFESSYTVDQIWESSPRLEGLNQKVSPPTTPPAAP
jgi:hypothetical protein